MVWNRPSITLGVTRVKDLFDAFGDGLDNAHKIAPPKPNTLGVLGDSITDFGSSTNSIYDGKNARGPWVWAQVYLGQRLLFVRDGGVASDTTAMMLARLSAYIGSSCPGWNIVLGGTNDAAGLVALATTTANLTAIYDGIEAAGGRVVAVTVPPRTGASSAVNTRINEINNWIKRQGINRPGLVVVDPSPKTVASTGYGWRTNYSIDGVHPYPYGAQVMGRAIADVLDPLIPKLSPLPSAYQDGTNLITNAFMNGTAGTANTGGTGQVADGWTVSAVDGVASVFTCSKVARTDDIGGEWQQVAVTSGQVKVHFHVTGYGTNYTAGDRIYAVAEFQTDDNFAQGDAVASNYFRLRAVATKPDFGDGFAGVDFDIAADTLSAPSSAIPRSGVFVTPVITVPSSATLRLAFEFQRRGAGTFRVGRVGLYREGTGPAY